MRLMMSDKIGSVAAVAAIFIVVYTPVIASAQIQSVQQLGSPALLLPDLPDPSTFAKIPVSLESVPLTPAPYEDIKITVTRYGTDIHSSEIVWRLNGKVELSGKGETIFRFKTGDLGSVSTVSVTVTAPGNDSASKTLIYRPATVDLYWEAISYTPPFYKGRAAAPLQSDIRIVAIPQLIRSDGTSVPDRNIHFKWKRDGRVLQEQSGYGRNMIILEKPLSTFTDIEVEAVAQSASLSGIQNTSITTSNPSLVLYEYNPLYGIRYERMLTDQIELKVDEVTIAAVPYFFSVKTRNDQALRWRWTMNSKTIKNFMSSDATFGIPSMDKLGKTSLYVTATHTNREFQRASVGTNMLYGREGDQTSDSSSEGNEFLR